MKIKWSDCKLAQQYDEERNFFPEPGPSTINYYENDDLKGYHIPISNENSTKQSNSASKNGHSKPAPPTPSMKKTQKCESIRNYKENAAPKSPQSDLSDWENDARIQSFYEQSSQFFTPNTQRKSPYAIDSPIISNSSTIIDQNANITLSTPVMANILNNLMKCSTSSVEVKPSLRKRKSLNVVRPETNAPNKKMVNGLLNANKIPKTVHPAPFYSNRNDITTDQSKKEVGNTVLQLKGNSINDMEEYTSMVNVISLSNWQNLAGENAIRCSSRLKHTNNHNNNKMQENGNNVRKQLARGKIIKIIAGGKPPANSYAKQWISYRSTIRNKNNSSRHHNGTIEDESPVNIRREKATSVLHQSDDEENVQNNNGFRYKFHDDALNGILANKNITVSLCRKNGKEKILLPKPNVVEHINCDSSDDEVICLNDTAEYKQNHQQDPLCSMVG